MRGETVARVGDLVRAERQPYRIAEIDDWGQFVCVNLDPDCMARDEVRTFLECEFECVVAKDEPSVFLGAGI